MVLHISSCYKFCENTCRRSFALLLHHRFVIFRWKSLRSRNSLHYIDTNKWFFFIKKRKMKPESFTNRKTPFVERNKLVLYWCLVYRYYLSFYTWWWAHRDSGVSFIYSQILNSNVEKNVNQILLLKIWRSYTFKLFRLFIYEPKSSFLTLLLQKDFIGCITFF